jgi:hypothetical protein
MTYIEPIGSGNAVWGGAPAAPSAEGERDKKPRILAYAPPPLDAPRHPYCDVPKISRVDFHFCVLETNWQQREFTRKKAYEETTTTLDNSLGLVSKEPKGAIQHIKGFLFSLARRIYFQADNWLLLDTAKKSMDMFFFSRGEQSYLTRAGQYLEIALKNKSSASFDLYHWSSFKDAFSPSIKPVEAYFELKLFRFQLLSLFDYHRALALGRELEGELRNSRLVQAQGSNDVSAEGYMNRLRLLYGFAGIYNPAMDPNQALQYVRYARAQAEKKHAESVIGLKSYDMNKKDLKYDILLSRIVEGRLLAKAGKYDAALEVFQKLFNEPAAFRKYGGFLDIGLQAFFSILQIALATSTSLEEASNKFQRLVPWDRIASEAFVDFRESAGLLIRQEKSGYSKVKTSKDWDLQGNWALYLDRPGLAPKDTTPVLSERKLANYKTPREKVELFMRLLKYSQLEFGQKNDIRIDYGKLKAAEMR